MTTGTIERIHPRQTRQAELSDDDRRFLDAFFVRMTVIYRNLWTSALTTEAMVEAAMREWADVFRAARLTRGQIMRTVDLCRTRFEMPPSPKQFIGLSGYSGEPAHRVDKERALPEPKEAREARLAKGRKEMRSILQIMKPRNGEPIHD